MTELVNKFKKLVTEKMEAKGMGTPIFEEVETPKKNIVLDSIIISRKDDNSYPRLSPTVHKYTLYELYYDADPEEREENLSRYADEVVKVFEETPDVSNVISFSYIKEYALPLILPKAKNLHLLETIPHEEILDEFIILYAVVARDENGHQMSFNISHNLIHKLATDNQMAEADVLLDIKASAMENLTQNTSVLSMIEQLKEMGAPNMIIEEMERDAGPTMLVVKTPASYGAAGAFISEDVQQQIHQKIGNFYILPSSIHETLCVPEEHVKVDALYEMVSQVNKTEVSETDFLSDNVFYYDGTLKKAV